MIGYVYFLSKNDSVFYVGSTTNLEHRKNNHISVHGEVDFTVVEMVRYKKYCREKLAFLESFWIDQFRQWGFNLLNICHNLNAKGRVALEVQRKMICIKCKKPIRHGHKFRKTNGYRHRVCKRPDSYV